MIIISSSNEDGTFYVETKSLDGETNVKTRNLQDDLKKLQIGGEKGKYTFSEFKCKANVEAPNANLHSLNGSISFKGDGESEDSSRSLSLKNVAFRGMSLRNTEWVVGMVMYTGK